MQVLAVPWVQLPGQQNILVQVIFNESDYAVRVTDLQNIWGEDLKRKGIQDRAKEIDCPIDAESNLVDLLKKLQDALTVDSASTTIVLKRSHDLLTLKTTEMIGRTALEWSFELEVLPFSAVATGLTLSLFSMMTFYQREIQSLLNVIEDKDTVIRQMNEFMKSANLVFKPNRRQKAFNKFSKDAWLDSSREKANNDQKTSQEVVDSLSLLGRDAEFRKDWRSVLSNVGKWDIKFLPDTTERTPGRVTSSIKPRIKSSIIHDPFADKPVLARDDTESQRHTFVSPQAQRIKDKHKIPTKWSSPVSSSHKSSVKADDSDDGFDDSPAQATPKPASSESPEASPTLRRSKQTTKMTDDDLTLPIYKLRDNRESQQLESDLDMATSSSNQGSDVASKKSPTPLEEPPRVEPPRAASDDTTDDTDDEEDLDAAPPSSVTKTADSPPRPIASTSKVPAAKTAEEKPVSRFEAKAAGESIPMQRDSSSDSQASGKSRRSQISNAPSRKPASQQSSAQNTPKKSRVLNFISPRKKGGNTSTEADGPEKAKSPARTQSPEEDSQVVDLEAERKKKALEKRKEAETLIKAPAKKRARKF